MSQFRQGAAALFLAAFGLIGGAWAQTPPGPTITTLLNEGYSIVAASSDVQSQFVYLQGTDAAGRKRAYACQLQFGTNGGFRGCLVLP